MQACTRGTLAHPFPNNLSNISLTRRNVSSKFGDSRHWEQAEVLWDLCDGNLYCGNSISLKRWLVLERQHENCCFSWRIVQSGEEELRYTMRATRSRSGSTHAACALHCKQGKASVTQTVKVR